MTEKTKIKVENFKIGRDTTSQINSGLIILFFGIIIMSFPVLLFSQIFDIQEISAFPTITGELSDVIFFLGFTVTAYGTLFLTSGITGWGIGGFIAAILYGNEGKNGPLYASYILARIVGGLAILLGPYFIISDPGILFIAVAVPVILLLISLPLILVAAVTYRIGLWISPSI